VRKTETIRTRSGQRIPLSSIPSDPDGLVRAVLELEVEFDELPGDEASVDPGLFHDELADYVDSVIRQGPPAKDEDLKLSFQESGRIGMASYWVFQCDLIPDAALYLYVVRTGAQTEIACQETAVTYYDSERDARINCLVSPAQMAAMDYVRAM